jgi:2-keto-3-deoxy-L-rhamnonate aldolase RhmA
MLDAEHGPLTPADAVNVARACDAVGITPLARVGQFDMKLVLQYLDAGIMGIMMPGIAYGRFTSTSFVQGCKYPPAGNRGLGPGRAADYLLGTPGRTGSLRRNAANEQLLILPQFEEIALLEMLPELTAVPGIDGFVIGPRDLALSMGYPDSANHPDVQQCYRRRHTRHPGGQFAGWASPLAARPPPSSKLPAAPKSSSPPCLDFIQVGAAQMLPPTRQSETGQPKPTSY